ncbi:uncharacterized protein LOC131856960 [Cryptomeria japonica]|uniref:uncharacterized protein LOC131856960 n=1 Tax=Cryptomeria japonica TaxID=3369 RepID=UPI0027DA94B4|nr:uncharacterized protein LOC131856960 [Cryptomeria japonica]
MTTGDTTGREAGIAAGRGRAVPMAGDRRGLLTKGGRRVVTGGRGCREVSAGVGLVGAGGAGLIGPTGRTVGGLIGQAAAGRVANNTGRQWSGGGKARELGAWRCSGARLGSGSRARRSDGARLGGARGSGSAWLVAAGDWELHGRRGPQGLD